MDKRELKFRPWIKSKAVMETPATLRDIVKAMTEAGDKLGPMTDFIADDVIYLQFTGIKDKNGKEIYEGDIAEDKVNNCIWRYIIQSLSFMGNNLFAVCIWRNFDVIDGEAIMGDYPIKDGNWNYISSTLNVIGNIYESKQLLEKVDH